MKNIKDTACSEIVQDSMELEMKNNVKNTVFSEIVEDSMELEIVKDSTDTQDDGDSLFSKIVQDSLDFEMVQDSMDTEDDEHLIDVTSSLEKKTQLDINSNIPAGHEFGLNKFPDEEDESSDEIKKEIKKVLKIYLPKFY